MKSAKEIREITDKKLEEINAPKIKKMKDYIEEVIAPQIEEAASQGKGYLTVAIDTTKAGTLDVARELIDNGYRTRGIKNSLMIYW